MTRTTERLPAEPGAGTGGRGGGAADGTVRATAHEREAGRGERARSERHEPDARPTPGQAEGTEESVTGGDIPEPKYRPTPGQAEGEDQDPDHQADRVKPKE